MASALIPAFSANSSWERPAPARYCLSRELNGISAIPAPQHPKTVATAVYAESDLNQLKRLRTGIADTQRIVCQALPVARGPGETPWMQNQEGERGLGGRVVPTDVETLSRQ